MQKLKQYFSNKTQTINLLIPILIAVFYLGLFLSPKIKQFSRLLSEASQLKTKIVNLEKEWAGIDSFNKKIMDWQEKLQDYERKLPSEKELPAILEYLSNSAKELDVKISEIKPVEQSKDKAAQTAIYYQAPILLLAECGYHELGRFLSKLESADRFMKISEIKIMAMPHQADRHFVRLMIVTYVMKK